MRLVSLTRTFGVQEIIKLVFDFYSTEYRNHVLIHLTLFVVSSCIYSQFKTETVVEKNYNGDMIVGYYT